MGFWDIFFASLGGQSPFLSDLTYASAALAIAGLAGPVAIIIGTLAAFINGYVVTRLSKRITEVGGYYRYAHKYLGGKPTGIFVGWNYIFYAVLYGAAYVIGASYIAQWILGIPWQYSLPASLMITTILAYLGIRISAKYAIFAGSLEMATLLLISVSLLLVSKAPLINPFEYVSKVPLPQLMVAVVYAIGIPTGYGTIAPLSGEVKRARETISRAVQSVIIAGGALAALAVYSTMIAGLSYMGLDKLTVFLNTVTSEGLSPVVVILHHYLGVLLDPIVVFTMINDGVLGALAYVLAVSRTLYAMAEDNLMPRYFSLTNSKGNPVIAVLVSAISMDALALAFTYALGPYYAFLVLGFLSMIGNLITHLTANLALLRAATKKLKAVLYGVDTMRNLEIALALIATAITIFITMESASGISVRELIPYGAVILLVITHIIITRHYKGRVDGGLIYSFKQ
ncbi:APC family permease [Vulcanisaeta thermophila]|uniref:APC family permease n=1 Tax=Vulcanisaeta thermophila TaxID=867917 RepID=UPI001EE1AB25|nr:APC family permease [Vulcanisaeta thermophila]